MFLYICSNVERGYDKCRAHDAGHPLPNWYASDGEAIISNDLDTLKKMLREHFDSAKEQLNKLARYQEEDYFPKSFIAPDGRLAFITTTEGSDAIYVIWEMDESLIPKTREEWLDVLPNNLFPLVSGRVPKRLAQICEECVLRPNFLFVKNLNTEKTEFFILCRETDFSMKNIKIFQQYKESGNR